MTGVQTCALPISSWMGDSNMNKLIPFYAELGNGGSSIYPYEGRPYVESARVQIDNKIKKTMISGYANLGISAY